MIIQVILALLALFYLPRLIKFLCSFYRKYTFITKLPGPKALPLLGNVLDFGKDSFDTGKYLIRAGNEELSKGNNIMRIWIGGRAVVIPLNGKALQPILESTEEITKGADYDFLIQWLGVGLMISTDEKWKSRRRMLDPIFHYSMLDGYVEKMDNHTKILLDILDEQVGNEIDVYPYVRRCALDIICDIAMGTQLNCQNDPSQPYVRAISDFTKLAVEYSLNPIYWFPPYWYATQHKKSTEYVTILTDFTKKVIADRIRAHEEGELSEEQETNGKRKAFLDMLIEMKANNSLSSEDIREEVDTFMFGGHFTTATGTSWALWCLATNPDIQDKLYSEVHELLGDDPNRSITIEDLKKLQYLDRVVKETLRLFPPAPMMTRSLKNDLTIGDHVVPSGTDVLICNLMTHHNKQVYPNDWKFDPDNFLPEKKSERHAYDYIPFSAGLRNCIGKKFALYEAKLILAHIINRFSVHTDRNMMDNECGPEVVLRPSLGIPITLKRRY